MMKLASLAFSLVSFVGFVFVAEAQSPPTGVGAEAVGNTCVVEVSWQWEGDLNSIDNFRILDKDPSGETGPTQVDTSACALLEGSQYKCSYLYEYRGLGSNDYAGPYSYGVQTQVGNSFFPSDANAQFQGPVSLFSSARYLAPGAPDILYSEWESPDYDLERAEAVIRWRADDLLLEGETMEETAAKLQVWRQSGGGGFDSLIEGKPSLFAEYDDNDTFLYYEFRDPIGDEGGESISNDYRYKVRALRVTEGCVPVEKRESDFSEEAVFDRLDVPPSTPSFTLTGQADPVAIFLNWGYNFSFDGRYEYTILGPGTNYLGGRCFNAGATDGCFLAAGAQSLTGANITARSNVTAGRSYNVELCVYRDSLPNSPSCSTQSVETGVARPEISSAVASNVSADGADISLRWTNLSDIPTVQFQAEWTTTPENEASWEGHRPASCRTLRVVRQCTFRYTGEETGFYVRVRALSGNEWSAVSSEAEWWNDSAEARFIDLDVKPLTGWAWASAGVSQGNVLGIGWISLNSANPTAGGGDYSVRVSSQPQDNGHHKMSGYAWSGTECEDGRPGDQPCGYGWLSFEQSDLIGCPSEGYDLNSCVAELDPITGVVRGWAKFVSVDRQGFTGAFPGWVRLRRTRPDTGAQYGVCFGNIVHEEDGTGWECEGNGDLERAEARMLSGWAWADDVGGWIRFNPQQATPVAGGGGECRVTGIQLQSGPRPPFGLDRTYDFNAQPTFAGDCTDVDRDELNALEWTSDSDVGGSIVLDTGEYTSPREYDPTTDGPLPFTETIAVTSNFNVDGPISYSFSFDILGNTGGGGGECAISMHVSESPNHAVPLGSTDNMLGVTYEASVGCDIFDLVAFVQDGTLEWSVSGGDSRGIIEPLPNNPTRANYTAPASYVSGPVEVTVQHTVRSDLFASADLVLNNSGDEECTGLGCVVDPPGCQPRGVEILGGRRSTTLSGDVRFEANVTYNRSGCDTDPSSLDWSVVEGSPAYGSVGTDSDSVTYTAPPAAPSGKALPFLATVRVQLAGTGLSDTEIVEVRDTQPLIRAQCATPPEDRLVNVRWSGVLPQDHTVEVYRGESPTDGGVLIHSASGLEEGGSCVDGGVGSSCSESNTVPQVEMSTDYYYKVQVVYGANETKVGVRPSRARCEPAVVAPTNLQVFTQSDTVLWVNWKDNDNRQDRKFFLERLRATPDVPKYDEDPLGFRVGPLSDSEIRLRWFNETYWTPYYHIAARFAGTTVPDGFSVENASRESLQSIAESNSDMDVFDRAKAMPERIPNSDDEDTRDEFSFIDSGLDEGETYHYRLSACSLVPLEDEAGSKYRTKVVDNSEEVGKPEIACGGFSDVITTTTRLKAPTDFEVEATTGFGTRLSWTDVSQKNEGYEVYRDSVVHGVGGDAEAWQETGLSPDTEYSYRVRAFADFGAGVGRIYSDFTDVKSVRTNFKVEAGWRGPGSVGYTPDEFASCGVNCHEYANGTDVTLTASPDGGAQFDGWTEDCSGQDATCTRTTNTNTTASFSNPSITVTLQIVGDGGGSVGGCSKEADVVSVNCGSTTYDSGSASFTYSAADGSVFGDWGPCQGVDIQNGVPIQCNVNQTGTLTVTFNKEGAGLSPERLFANVVGGAERALRSFSRFVRGAAPPLFEKVSAERGEILRFVQNDRGVGQEMYEVSGFAGISELVKPLISRGRNFLTSLFVSPSVRAQDAIDYEDYFELVEPLGLEEAAHGDDGLEPGTVYVYRVKSCVGGVNGECTSWSAESAGKTLRDATEDTAGALRPICTRNSFCNYGAQFTKRFSLPLSGGEPDVERSQQQCTVNADCANVGRSRQNFQEN